MKMRNKDDVEQIAAAIRKASRKKAIAMVEKLAEVMFAQGENYQKRKSENPDAKRPVFH